MLGYLVGNSLVLTVPKRTFLSAFEGKPGHASGSANGRGIDGLMPGGCRRSLTAGRGSVHIRYMADPRIHPVSYTHLTLPTKA